MKNPRFLFLLVLLTTPASAGVVFELETQDHTQSPPRLGTSTTAVEGSLLTMEIQGDSRSGGGQVIYRGDRREMIVVDPQQQSFIVMDVETINALAQQLQQMKSQFGGMIDNVPEAQREYVQQMLQRQQQNAQAAVQPTQLQVRNVGDHVTVNGYPCARYEVYRNGRKVSDLWVTDWKNVEGGQELRPVFTGMAEFFQQMTQAFAQQAGTSESTFGDNMFVLINELDGFPVATYNYDENGNVEDAAILRTSRRGRLDPAAFEPPAGYRQQHLFGPR